MDLALRCERAEDTRAAGAALAASLRTHDVLVLTGELGAGKTTLVQGIAKGLGATDHVASPTFTLVREYVSGRIPVAHVDVYRLTRVQDVMDLALDELTGGEGVLIVEWGDAVDELLAPDRLEIVLRAADPSGLTEARLLTLHAAGPSWAERAEELAAALAPWKDAA